MEKSELYGELLDVEERLKDMLIQITEMKNVVNSVLEKNVSLELENQHLRDRLEKMIPYNSDDENKQELSKSRLNLEKLYEEGFHVCKDFYGIRRDSQVDCIFCSQMIYGNIKSN